MKKKNSMPKVKLLDLKSREQLGFKPHYGRLGKV